MKLDILAFGAHPDDVELSCSGTLLKQIDLGHKVGLVDLTAGELGTRGTVATRKEEAEASRIKMGALVREQLNLGDGFFEINEDSLIAVVRMIRKYQPNIILANAKEDRHPDHGRGAALLERATFLSGLVKIETQIDGKNQAPWRAKALYHYIQDRNLEPDFVFDISGYMQKKLDLVLCFKTQFYNPDSGGPQTPISSKAFLDFLSAKAATYGRAINAEHAEAYNVSRHIGVDDLTKLI